jgi:iron complex outermembrane receptor protein
MHRQPILRCLSIRPAGTPPPGWKRPLCALALALAAASPRAGDLTEQPLETLLDAEVSSAAGFARQISAAASAVSVLTSEDIRVLGLRTLGEVLDQMRGLHVSHSTDYVFLGARGIGGPQSLAGRVLLMVDGVPALDNLFDQPYLGHDAVIDVALIERIEYAPGPGSAMYGDNAFLGVINVVTKRGRDVDGLQVSASGSDWGDRAMRVTAGKRLAGGAEWLMSVTAHHNTGLPSDEIGDLFVHSKGNDHRLFLKARWEGFSMEAWSAERERTTADPSVEFGEVTIDRNQLVSIAHDGSPAEGWRSTVRLQAGHYAYRYDLDAVADTGPFRFAQADNGNWWALEGQLGYVGWADHHVALGVRLRRDPLLRVAASFTDASGVQADAQDDNRRSLGLSAEDEYTLSAACRAIGGVRVDHPDFSRTAWSPLLALACEPTAGWTMKLSEGRATRFASVAESGFGQYPSETADERVTTQELVSEYKQDSLRLLASMYRYGVSGIFRAPDAARKDAYTGTKGRGVELEAEWQWHGLKLRGSQAWQYAESADGSRLNYSPRSVTKMMASVPLHGEALRASLSLRRVGDFRDSGYSDPVTGELLVGPKPVPARTLLDLTAVSQQWLPGLDVRVGVRNLLGQREQALDNEFGYQPPTNHRQRTAWIEFTGTFR